MKLFACPACKQVVFFGNVRCERCATALGYEPESNRLLAVGDDLPFVYCANRPHDVCNWLVPAGGPPDQLCRACRHDVIIPDLSLPANIVLWRKLEQAKHRLLYTILRLRLPLFDRTDRPDGLGFQFLAADDLKTQVMTGHAGGLITIALVEADDAAREQRRTKLREPYRTLLGHFRHEVGHWYWDVLVRDQPALARFTELFGDAQLDYADALAKHYADGPRADSQTDLISPYAGSHPWEDFAETWAHYFHMIDTLETGGSYRISLTPRLDHEGVLTTTLDFDVYDPAVEVTTLISAWVALSSAINSFNRSMGIADAYPFVLSPKVIEKIGFVHELRRQSSVLSAVANPTQAA